MPEEDVRDRTRFGVGRVLIALHVPWSGDAVRGSKLLDDLRGRLSSLNVTCAVLDEDDPQTRKWVARFGLPDFDPGHARGAATFLWLEDGLLQDVEVSVSRFSVDELETRTHRWWGGRIGRPVQPGDILGKPIARILQTPWEHTETYSNCDFYLMLADRTLFEAELFGHFVLIDPESVFARMLIDIETDTEYPACWATDGFLGEGAHIERAFTYGEGVSTSNFYLLLSTGHLITTDLLEGCPQLYILDRKHIEDGYTGTTVYDYWTREPHTIR